MLPSDEMAKFLGIGYRQLITLILDKSVVIFDKNEVKVQNWEKKRR
jgi:phage antirepressor YoqD-like protein